MLSTTGGTALSSPRSRNACSTAMMQSSMVSKLAISRGVSTRIFSAFMQASLGDASCLQKHLEVRAGRNLDRLLAAPKDACSVRSLQHCGAALHPEHRPLAQTQDRSFVFFKELRNALLLRFSHVRRRRVGAQIVRTDLERYQAQCVEP